MKTAVVTGASTGIGRAVAIELSKNGYQIFLVARREEELRNTEDQIRLVGGQAKSLPTDLSSLDSLNQLITTIRKETSHVDLIANIAAIWHGPETVYAGKDYETFDQKIILDTFMVGTVAPALLVHGLLPIMSSGAKIINLSGTFENGANGWLPYYVSKRAIEDLTVGLSQELKDKGICVNCISPSDTATESYEKFFPQYMEDAVDPIEIAKKFVDLSSDQNNITGKVFVIKKGEATSAKFHF